MLPNSYRSQIETEIDTGRQVFSVAKGAAVFAMTRHRCTGDRGAQNETLTQSAGEGRSGTDNLVQEGEPGAGGKSGGYCCVGLLMRHLLAAARGEDAELDCRLTRTEGVASE
jgi:hypothetical protein